MFSRFSGQALRGPLKKWTRAAVQARAAFTTADASQSHTKRSWTTTAMSAVLVTGGIGLYVYSNTAHANMADEGLHAPHYPWSHKAPWATFNYANVRRGFQVYRDVCSSCHSLQRIAWRNLVGTTHSEDEVKAMAEEVEYTDGPDDNGEYFQRPGRLSDYLPKPYANEEAARAANNGAFPPDLSLIIDARHGGADYVFSLLTGYYDPPAGLEIREGMSYNPYFPGGAIAMARVLYDDLLEYEDGTPATTSQMAKDVTEFLCWASEPEHDQRKKAGLKAMAVLFILLGLSIWLKRNRWMVIKSRKIVHAPPKS